MIKRTTVIVGGVGMILLMRWLMKQRKRRIETDIAILKLLEERWEICINEKQINSKKYRIMTWNVLADSYAYGQRHCQRGVLKLSWRRQRLLQIIHRARADVVCLQEADHSHWWIKELSKLGYDCCVAPRANFCPDAAITAWLRKKLRGEGRVVRFDRCLYKNDVLSARFQRHNVGLICTLIDKIEKNYEFIVANAHLHWNPARGDVKLYQMWALLKATERAVSQKSKEKRAVIICGDLNSLPDSPPIQLVLDGNAKVSAEIYGQGLVSAYNKKEQTNSIPPSIEIEKCDKIALDFNQNKLCRWLRLVGIDTLLETPEEAERRCRSGSVEFALRAQKERRFLVTSSRSFSARREVQNLPHLLLPSSTSTEHAFAAVIRKTNIVVKATDALTRCVRCNGCILECDFSRATELRKQDAETKKIPHDPKVVLYECDNCKQVFWWSERDNSSAARAAKLADKLKTLAEQTLSASIDDEIQESSILLEDDVQDNAFYVEKNSLNKDFSSSHFAPDGLAPTPTTSAILLNQLTTGISHNLGKLDSVIAPSSNFVTNYVPNFFGQIDWLFFSRSHWRLLGTRKLPTCPDLSTILGTQRTSFLPCRAWPSDHIAIVADLELCLYRSEKREAVDSCASLIIIDHHLFSLPKRRNKYKVYLNDGMPARCSV